MQVLLRVAVSVDGGPDRGQEGSGEGSGRSGIVIFLWFEEVRVPSLYLH